MSILKALRALSRREADADDTSEFIRQINLGSNDRGAALLQATHADMALTKAIYRVLSVSDDMRDRVDGSGGPLETFSQRITMGRVLGIYGEDTEYNLNLIRQIRNTFAHAHTPITFMTKEIADAITLFRDVPILPPYTMGSDKAQAPTEPRAKFNFFCVRTTHNLIIAAAHAKRRVPI